MSAPFASVQNDFSDIPAQSADDFEIGTNSLVSVTPAPSVRSRKLKSPRPFRSFNETGRWPNQ